MKQIIIIEKDTFEYLCKTLKQCHDWLNTDAQFAHSRSNIKVVETNVVNSVRMINGDLEKYKDNCKILVEQLNKQAENV